MSQTTTDTPRGRTKHLLYSFGDGDMEVRLRELSKRRELIAKGWNASTLLQCCQFLLGLRYMGFPFTRIVVLRIEVVEQLDSVASVIL